MGAMTLYCMHQLLRCHEYYRNQFVIFRWKIFLKTSIRCFSTSRTKCDFGDIMRYTLETCRWSFARRHAKFGKWEKIKRKFLTWKDWILFRFLIDGFIVLIQLGFCSVYFVFVPASIKQVVDQYTPHSPAIQVYQFVMLILIIGFSMIRSLKVLAPFSLAANVITIGGKEIEEIIGEGIDQF